MSQSRQSNSTTAHAGTSPDTDTLVAAYAEDLMDEVFEDVDRILAGDEAAIYAASTAQEQQAPSLFTTEAVTVPAMIVPVSTAQAVEPSQVATITEPEPDAAASDGPDTSSEKPSRQRPWKILMLGAVGLSAAVALGVWWMRQQPALQTVPSAPAASAVSSETAFGEYLKRSLQVINGERSAQVASQGTGTTVPVPPTSGIQTPTAQVPGVIERVFIPMLQPGAGVNPGTPSVTLPSLPAPAGPGAQPGTAPIPNPVPNIAAASTYELVGVLELGEGSAALFNVNGTSQRVYVGETIGSSGWSIVSIASEEVVVRRNGEVRSIYIGQQF